MIAPKFKDKSYYDEYLEILSEEVEDSLDYFSEELDEEQTQTELASIFFDSTNACVVEFSAGREANRIVGQVERTLDLAQKYDFDYFESYVKVVWILSLGICLKIPAEHFVHLKEQVVKRVYCDWLISKLLSVLFNDFQPYGEILDDGPYQDLKGFFDSGENLNPEDLKGYLGKWYNRHRGATWYDAHKIENHAHTGYWAFETAVLVKLFSIDDSSLRDVDYYPYRLLHFDEFE